MAKRQLRGGDDKTCVACGSKQHDGSDIASMSAFLSGKRVNVPHEAQTATGMRRITTKGTNVNSVISVTRHSKTLVCPDCFSKWWGAHFSTDVFPVNSPETVKDCVCFVEGNDISKKALINDSQDAMARYLDTCFTVLGVPLVTRPAKRTKPSLSADALQCILCTSQRIPKFVFCRDHKCIDCENQRAHGTDQCQDHMPSDDDKSFEKCPWDGCDADVLIGYACSAHMCKHNVCVKARVSDVDSKYCITHKCKHCPRKVTFIELHTCQSCTCATPNCSEPSKKGGLLCEKCCCKKDGCLNPRTILPKGSLACSAHVCDILMCTKVRYDGGESFCVDHTEYCAVEDCAGVYDAANVCMECGNMYSRAE